MVTLPSEQRGASSVESYKAEMALDISQAMQVYDVRLTPVPTSTLQSSQVLPSLPQLITGSRACSGAAVSLLAAVFDCVLWLVRFQRRPSCFRLFQCTAAKGRFQT